MCCRWPAPRSPGAEGGRGRGSALTSICLASSSWDTAKKISKSPQCWGGALVRCWLIFRCALVPPGPDPARTAALSVREGGCRCAWVVTEEAPGKRLRAVRRHGLRIRGGERGCETESRCRGLGLNVEGAAHGAFALRRERSRRLTESGCAYGSLPASRTPAGSCVEVKRR